MERSEELYKELKETIEEYPLRINELEFFCRQDSNFFIHDRKTLRIEKFARNIDSLLNLLKDTDLSDKEVTFIDFLLDGMSINEVTKFFSISRSRYYPMLENIINKMVNTYIQTVGD
jgi:hypothetical protein